MQYLFHLASYVWHLVCLFLGWVTYVWHWVCLVFLWELCWALGLSVCWLGDLCLALRLSVICGNYVGHGVCLFVCLFVGWVTYDWHCVCLLFVGIMLGIGFVCLLVG